MELNEKNLMKIGPGENFALFISGKLVHVLRMSAEQRFINILGSLVSMTPGMFLKDCDAMGATYTIYCVDCISEPINK